MRKRILIFCFGVLVVGVTTLVWNHTAKGNPDIPDTRLQSAEWNIKPKEEDTAKLQSVEVGDSVLAALSADEKYEIYTKNGDNKNVYLYDRKKEDVEKIEVTNDLDLETMIMSLKWVSEKEFAVISHVNPSLNCLSVYNAKTKEKKMEKFGSLFEWKNEDYNSLIYVFPAPHFAEYSGKEEVMNADDEVLYQTVENEVVENLSVNEETGDLALLTNKSDSIRESDDELDNRKVILLKKHGVNKYKNNKVKSWKKGKVESLHWSGKRTVKLEGKGGNSTVKMQ